MRSSSKFKLKNSYKHKYSPEAIKNELTDFWLSSWEVRSSLYSLTICKLMWKNMSTLLTRKINQTKFMVASNITEQNALQHQLYCSKQPHYIQNPNIRSFHNHHYQVDNVNLAPPTFHLFWTELDGAHNYLPHNPKHAVFPILRSNSVVFLSNVLRHVPLCTYAKF